MSSRVDELLSLPPFGLNADAKTAALLSAVQEELTHHYEHCAPFQRWCRKRGFDPHNEIEDLAEVPFLPANIFKRMTLRSVPDEQVVRVLASSATSSQIPAQVALDATTRNRQIRSLAAILTHLLGGSRRPFVILDAPPETGAQSSRELSARAAGMRGFLIAATTKDHVLESEGGALTLDVEKMIGTIDRLKAGRKPFCLLGYTYVLYQHVVQPLRQKGLRLELPEDVRILHFGGWKKLRQQAVDKATLNAHSAEVFGVPQTCICDVYGFTEQLGVIYPDDTDGLKRAPTYAEVFVRDPRTLELAPDGELGLLEFVCPLPHGYPGVAVLLDDIGRIASRQPGSSGITGTGFEVVGRAEGAEARGCGDTLPRQVYEVGPRK
jgi:hypothetical protein